MRALGVAAILLLVTLAGCFGGGKGRDDGDDPDGDKTDPSDSGSASRSGTTSRTGTSGTRSSSATGTSAGTTSGSGTSGPSTGGDAPPRTPDLWFNGSRMDLTLKGDGTVRDVLLEATVAFAIHSAVVTKSAGVAVAMVPEAAPAAACTTGASGPLVAAGEAWVDAMGLGERPAGRYRFVYREPSSASIAFILGDVTLDNVPVEVTGKPTNATIEVRAATWSTPSAGQPRTASDTLTLAGRAVVAAGSRVDYDTAAGPVRVSNDVDVGGADCAQGQRDANAGASFGHLQHAVAATVQDAQLQWAGSVSGVFVEPVPSGGLVVVHLA